MVGMDTVGPASSAPVAAPAPGVTATRSPAPVIRYSQVPWRRIGLFTLIAYGLFALAAAPF